MGEIAGVFLLEVRLGQRWQRVGVVQVLPAEHDPLAEKDGQAKGQGQVRPADVLVEPDGQVAVELRRKRGRVAVASAGALESAADDLAPHQRERSGKDSRRSGFINAQYYHEAITTLACSGG